MDLIKRLARSHMARAYGLAGIALVILIVGVSVDSAALTGTGAIVAFMAGAEWSGEVICDRCGTSLDSEELPDGTEPDSGETGFRLHRTAEQIANDGIRRWYDEPNRSRLDGFESVTLTDDEKYFAEHGRWPEHGER